MLTHPTYNWYQYSEGIATLVSYHVLRQRYTACVEIQDDHDSFLPNKFWNVPPWLQLKAFFDRYERLPSMFVENGDLCRQQNDNYGHPQRIRFRKIPMRPTGPMVIPLLRRQRWPFPARTEVLESIRMPCWILLRVRKDVMPVNTAGCSWMNVKKTWKLNVLPMYYVGCCLQHCSGTVR